MLEKNDERREMREGGTIGGGGSEPNFLAFKEPRNRSLESILGLLKV
jgi:hypothetical protein